MREYPDISALLERKAKRRRELANLPFEAKIELVRLMQERRRAIKDAVRINEGLQIAAEIRRETDR